MSKRVTVRRWIGRGAGLVTLALIVMTFASGCSPVYVLRAGFAEAKILAARRPIVEVAADPETDEDTRDKLYLAMDARRFVIEELELDAGDSYTSYTKLDRDTLALVVSAAHRDRLASKTWWFPIVGRVPYRGFFSLKGAEEFRDELEAEGFDVLMRATGAFSTLGWFSDPLLSTVLRYGEISLVETIIHELTHNHLFVPGRVRFNESFASFVGATGAARFFCAREGGGPDSALCQQARERWQDDIRFSAFLDVLVERLQEIYGDPRLSSDQKVERREEIFGDALDHFRADVQPTFEINSFQWFLDQPLNNATLLSRMRYYHRLGDFQRFLDNSGGDLRMAIRTLAHGVEKAEDPFDLLPTEVLEAGR
jgi:predicted aminopeptidase